MKIRVIDIEWDIGGATPEQAGVPEFIDIELPDDADVNTAIERTLNGFTVPHKGFNWEADPEGWGESVPLAGSVNVKATVTPESAEKAIKVLADNGIEPDECATVLQAVGYALLGVELEPALGER